MEYVFINSYDDINKIIIGNEIYNILLIDN